jgi:hypothetical protein
MTAGDAGKGRSLEVTLSGGGLPEEVVAKINRAVQRAVLSELADLDLGAARVQLLSAERAQFPGGPTDGIVVQLEAF